MLSEHIRGSLAVPGEKQGPSFEVKVLLDSGSGITAITEALARRLEIQLPGIQVRCPFQGSARVMCAFGNEEDIKMQTCPLHLALGSPWGKVQIAMPFVILPGPWDFVIWGSGRCVTCWVLVS